VWSAVCLLVMFVSHAKTAEPIEMLFGVLTRVGLRKHLSFCMVHWKALRVSAATLYAAKNQ